MSKAWCHDTIVLLIVTFLFLYLISSFLSPPFRPFRVLFLGLVEGAFFLTFAFGFAPS